MARSDTALEEMYANLVIADEEEEGIIVSKEEVVASKKTYMLVGRFLTEKNINYNAMQNVMAGLWRPKEGMEVYDMGDLRYSFVFFHALDIQKVIEGGPWSFEQAMLVYHQVQDGEDPTAVPLQHVEMWVQIYDIPRGFLSENILKSVGSSIGTYIKSDQNTFVGGWKPYVRIRVLLDINKPLKRRLKIKREGDNWSWLNFKYERLGTFCFVCGIIGHSERDCNIVYAHPEKMVEKAYGAWLRAPNKNAKNNTGARWIRNMGDKDGAWGQNQNKAKITVHGGEKVEERFMEIDGSIRQATVDTEGIRIQSRENREGLLSGEIAVTKERQEMSTDMVVTEMEAENIVMENKRKRVDEDLIGDNHGLIVGEDVSQNSPVGPKNLLMAGPGVQARQES